MNLAEAFPQNVQPLPSISEATSLLSSPNALRHRVRRLPRITSSHPYFQARIEGFSDASDLVINLSTMHNERRNGKPLSRKQKNGITNDAALEIANEMAQRIMSANPHDTTYAIALWEQLSTAACLKGEAFEELQPIVKSLHEKISTYLQDPIQFGYITHSEQQSFSRRFNIIRRVKPRRTFHL